MSTDASVILAPCNTFNAVGFHLADLDQLKNKTREVVTYLASHLEDFVFAKNMLPTVFSCSHCGSPHYIGLDGLEKALFHGPGAIDKTAAFDEYKAIMNGRFPAEAGLGLRNATSRSTDETLADLFGIDTTGETAITDEKTEEKEIGSNDGLDSTNGSADDSGANKQPVQSS